MICENCVEELKKDLQERAGVDRQGRPFKCQNIRILDNGSFKSSCWDLKQELWKEICRYTIPHDFVSCIPPCSECEKSDCAPSVAYEREEKWQSIGRRHLDILRELIDEQRHLS